MGFLNVLKKKKMQSPSLRPATFPNTSFPGAIQHDFSDISLNLPTLDLPKPINLPRPPKIGIPADAPLFSSVHPQSKPLEVTQSKIQPVSLRPKTIEAPLSEPESDVPSEIPPLEVEKARISAKERDVLHRRTAIMPLFIRVDNFKVALNHLNSIKNNLTEAESNFQNINIVRSNKNQQLTLLDKSLEEIEKKLICIDKTLFG